MAEEIQKLTEAEQEQEVAERRAVLQKAHEAGNRPFDMERIEIAYRMAKEKHSGQFRQSGETYIIHPLAVATIVAELGMDTESVMAALLHDVVEDTDVSLEQIEKKFGKEIAALVDGLTKLGRIPYSSREEQQAENIRKMLIAMADDIRVIIIKLADRLHICAPTASRRAEAARYRLGSKELAPIAHRLYPHRQRGARVLHHISTRRL